MARSESTLSSELLAVVPVSNAATAASNLAQAYGDYMKDAESNSVPVVDAFIDSTCVPAMAAAMVFSEGDTAAQGAAKFTAGFVAFWAAAVASPAAFIVGATAITPPSFASLSSALTATFGSNVGPPAKSLVQAAAALASNIHAATNSSPTATFTTPTFPIN